MSRIADIALSAWILFVAVVYFGGYFNPAIGLLTPVLGKVYAGMLIASAIVVCWRWLTRQPVKQEA
jgi:hypothetical protein